MFLPAGKGVGGGRKRLLDVACVHVEGATRPQSEHSIESQSRRKHKARKKTQGMATKQRTIRLLL